MTEIITDNDQKLRIATCSLAGCFGCHMSFLDIDEWLTEVDKHFEFDRSPFTDIKTIQRADIGLIEGGLCNEENVEVLHHFRANCKTIVAVGACAINGGVPALRNHYSLEACIEEVYENGYGLQGDTVPTNEELPPLLARVLPIHEVVQVDYFLPGCPPPAQAFAEFLQALLAGKEPTIRYVNRHFD
jgi:NAD-reducing hydrogenase small subunit